MPVAARGRNWIWTTNNPDHEAWQWMWDSLYSEDRRKEQGIVAFACQEEKGKQGTVHIQGVIFMDKRYTLCQMKEILPKGSHLEVMRGTAQQAIAYCTKEDSRTDGPWTTENLPRCTKGRRSDLEEIKKDLLAGMKEIEYSVKHFPTYVRYAKSLRDFAIIHAKPRNWVMEVIIHYGVPGSGKTMDAMKYSENSVYKLPTPTGSVLWWNGYAHQETVVIDEFVGNIMFQELLQLCDRHAHYVQTKGGFMNFDSKRIVFTSNRNWIDWYPNMFKDQNNYGAFTRRITKVYYYPQLHVRQEETIGAKTPYLPCGAKITADKDV